MLLVVQAEPATALGTRGVYMVSKRRSRPRRWLHPSPFSGVHHQRMRIIVLLTITCLLIRSDAIAAGGLLGSENEPVDLEIDVHQPVPAGEEAPVLDLDAANRIVRELAGTILGEDPSVLIAPSLASAIREAEASYEQTAKALPETIKRRLRALYSPELLERARWTVGRLEINLPAAINQGMALFGHEHHAVTVGRTIVFSHEPELGLELGGDALAWWAHELRHVEQYRDLGIDGFALAYVRDPAALERDADQMGARATVAGSR
jgi:uncharacterized protein DUF4157